MRGGLFVTGVCALMLARGAAYAQTDDVSDGGVRPFGKPRTVDGPADGGEPLTIEEWDAAPSTAASSDGGTLSTESFESTGSSTSAPIESAEEATPAGPTARVYGSVRAQAGVDTRFDSPKDDRLAENI